MAKRNRCTQDKLVLERTGVTHSIVGLDYDWLGESATLECPLTVVHPGDSPYVLVLGGTHGDEFEGQLAARRSMWPKAAPNWPRFQDRRNTSAFCGKLVS